jgi:hypothetical protein
VDLAARQHISQRMPDELADTQLALGWAGVLLGSSIGH